MYRIAKQRNSAREFSTKVSERDGATQAVSIGFEAVIARRTFHRPAAVVVAHAVATGRDRRPGPSQHDTVNCMLEYTVAKLTVGSIRPQHNALMHSS